MSVATLSPLNFLIPNGPDHRLYFRLMQIVGIIASALIPAFIIYTQLAGRFPSEVQYGTVLYLGLITIFCLYPAFKSAEGHRTFLDLLFNLVLIAGATFAYAYFTDQYDDIADMREGLPNQWDLACYLVGSVVVVFGAHRAEGWLLTAVVMLAIIYLLFGHVMPGILEHRPFSMNRVLEISYGYRGIFGVALGAVVDIVLVFVILGVTLRLTGAGDFFNDLALILTRGKRSGPAQCASLLCHVWLYQWVSTGQCGVHWYSDHSYDASGGIFWALCRWRRSHGILCWSNHATSDGGRRVYHV